MRYFWLIAVLLSCAAHHFAERHSDDIICHAVNRTEIRIAFSAYQWPALVTCESAERYVKLYFSPPMDWRVTFVAEAGYGFDGYDSFVPVLASTVYMDRATLVRADSPDALIHEMCHIKDAFERIPDTCDPPSFQPEVFPRLGRR